MVAQLAILGAILLALILAGFFVLIYQAITNLKSIAEQALLASRSVSARDLAEAKEYSADASMSREFAREQAGPAIASVSPEDPVYTTPDGVKLKVLKPFL